MTMNTTLSKTFSTGSPRARSLDQEARIDLILEGTFPASDAPAWSSVRENAEAGSLKELVTARDEAKEHEG